VRAAACCSLTYLYVPALAGYMMKPISLAPGSNSRNSFSRLPREAWAAPTVRVDLSPIKNVVAVHRLREVLCNSFEDRLDLAIIAGAQDKNLHTDDARRLLHVFQLALKACLQAGRVCLSSAHRTRRFQPCSSTPAASRSPV
jgi:hypothetical protein